MRASSTSSVSSPTRTCSCSRRSTCPAHTTPHQAHKMCGCGKDGRALFLSQGGLRQPGREGGGGGTALVKCLADNDTGGGLLGSHHGARPLAGTSTTCSTSVSWCAPTCCEPGACNPTSGSSAKRALACFLPTPQPKSTHAATPREWRPGTSTWLVHTLRGHCSLQAGAMHAQPGPHHAPPPLGRRWCRSWLGEVYDTLALWQTATTTWLPCPVTCTCVWGGGGGVPGVLHACRQPRGVGSRSVAKGQAPLPLFCVANPLAVCPPAAVPRFFDSDYVHHEFQFGEFRQAVDALKSASTVGGRAAEVGGGRRGHTIPPSCVVLHPACAPMSCVTVEGRVVCGRGRRGPPQDIDLTGQIVWPGATFLGWYALRACT